MPPKVSLAMPVFNGQNYVSQAIESALAQDFTDFEFIISDNASSDRTAQIAQHFADQDSRIRYIRNQRNIGACGNFNRGVELAQGEYFKWFNHDDMVSSNYLSECVKALDLEPRAVLAYGRTEVINSKGRTTGEDPRGLPDMSHDEPAKRFRDALIFGGTMHEMHGLFRTDALKRTQLHRPYFGSDRALLAELALLGCFVQAPEAVYYGRDHPERSFKADEKSLRAEFAGGPSTSRLALEQLPLSLHLLELAWSYRNTCPCSKTLPLVGSWAMKPNNLFRVASELVWMAFPSSHQRLRSAAWRFLYHKRI